MSKTFDRYLYAIGMLKEKYLYVRAVDVAHCLGVSKASVSVVNLLFTATGKNRSDWLGERVSFFRQLLTDAGVEPSQALRDAISFSWEMSEAAFVAFRRLYAGASAE